MQVNIDRMVLASIMLISIVGIFGVNLALTFNQISNLVISGILGLVLGDSFLFKSFQLIGARLGIIIMAAVPVLSTILAFFFLNEVISFLGMFGMLLTIAGILIVVLERKIPDQNKISIKQNRYFLWISRRTWSGKRINICEVCFPGRRAQWICCKFYQVIFCFNNYSSFSSNFQKI